MAKGKDALKSFSAFVKVDAQFEVTVKAETMERALEIARQLPLKQVLQNPANDASLSVEGIFTA